MYFSEAWHFCLKYLFFFLGRQLLPPPVHWLEEWPWNRSPGMLWFSGCGATFNGFAVMGVWTGPQLHWHINCLELLAVRLALNRLKRRLRGKHILVRTPRDLSFPVVLIPDWGNTRYGRTGTRLASMKSRPPEVPDQSRGVRFAARVGVRAVSLHP